MKQRKQKPPHRLDGWSEVGEVQNYAPFVSIVPPGEAKGNGGPLMLDKATAHDVITEMVGGQREMYGCLTGAFPEDAPDIRLLTEVCIERAVPFA